MYNTCTTKENIYALKNCGAPVPPPPPPAPTASNFALDTIKSMFKNFNITGVDPSICVTDVGRADIQFHDFTQDVSSKNYSMALTSLSRGLYAVSTAMGPCGVPNLQDKVDMLAAAVHWADVGVKDAKVLVGMSNLWDDIEGIAKAVSSGDTAAVGTAIGKLTTDWSTIGGGGCKETAFSKACTFLDGFLKLAQAVVQDIRPCQAALTAPLEQLTNATTLFLAKQYQEALQPFAAGLDGVSKAIGSDSCGLGSLASIIGQVVPRLSGAIVKVESSTSVKILAGSTDLYDILYRAAVNFEGGGLGEEMGTLLNLLKTTACSTKGCIILQGALAALQVEAQDFTACAPEVDAAWNSIPTAVRHFETNTVEGMEQGLASMATFVADAAQAITKCGVSDVGAILEATAQKLGGNTTATELGVVVQALVSGSDITQDISKVVADVRSGQWLSLGHDLGALATWLNSVQCTTFLCKITEGILTAVEIPFQNLTGCEADLSAAQYDFLAGTDSMMRLDFDGALSFYSNGLQTVTRSVADCGMARELIFLEQEANMLALGNATVLGKAASIISFGADFFTELYAAQKAFEAGDYRTVGHELGKVMTALGQWTEAHACKQPFCYVVSGIMQYVGEIEGSIQACEMDFEHSFLNFTEGFGKIGTAVVKTDAGDFHFNSNLEEIVAGVHMFGMGMKDVAQGVGDCHFVELSALLIKLSHKFSLAPEIGWLQEILHILIDGKHIEQEIGDACLAFGGHNYPAFGFNLAKLIKELVT